MIRVDEKEREDEISRGKEMKTQREVGKGKEMKRERFEGRGRTLRGWRGKCKLDRDSCVVGKEERINWNIIQSWLTPQNTCAYTVQYM